MIQRKDFVTIILLSIITCGIYFLFYVYQTTKELNQMAGNDGDQMEPALAVVICLFLPIIWHYIMGKRMQNMGNANGIPIAESGNTYLLWILLGCVTCGITAIYGYYLFVKNFNILADAYNSSMGPNQYQNPYSQQY